MNFTSDSLFDKNYELFRKRFPQFANLISKEKALEFAKTGCMKIQFFQAKNGNTNATFEEKALHSKYDPLKEAQNLIHSEQICSSQTSIFFGYGLGYGTLEFASEHKKKSLLIIEPDLEFAFLPFLTTDLETLFNHEKLILLFGLNFNEIIGFLDSQKIENYYLVKNPALTNHNIEYFSQLEKLLKRNQQKQEINKNTLTAYGKLWINNTCRNFSKIDTFGKVKDFQNKFPGSNAIVLAAGPTLEETLPHLKKIRENCIVICVDTALRKVLKSGIKPDFVVVMDSQYWNSRHLDFTNPEESILITESAVHPSVLRKKWKGIFLCNSQYPLGKILETDIDLGKLGAGGSVATTSWDFARFLGCTSIFMAGLDLGFPKNQTHTKGATFEKWALMNSTRINNSETFSIKSQFDANALFDTSYNGEKIRTDSRMKMYAWWFESKCAEFPEIKTFSLSDKSLSIPGIKTISISEVENGEKLSPSIREEISDSINLKESNYAKMRENLNKFLKTPTTNEFFEDLLISFSSSDELINFIKKSI